MKEPSDKERLEGSEFAVGSPKTAWKFMAVAYVIAFGVVHLASGGAIPLIYLVAFVPAIVLLASGKARQWFTYKNDALTLRSQGKLVDLPISDLRVKSGGDLQILDQPEIEFSSMTTRTVSKLLGSSHILTPEAVILLAELQKRGAAIDVLGYGSFTGRLEQGKVPAEVRFPFMELYLFACGFFLFIFYLGVQSNDRLEPAVLDLLFPIVLFGFLIWGGYIGLLGLRAINRKRGIYPLALNINGDRVVIERQGKITNELDFDEIKSILVTLFEKGSDRDLISVSLTTHYSRQIKLVDKTLVIPYGVSNFLEHARRKGVTVVYQKLRRGADVPDVIWEAKAEKTAPRFDSGEKLFESPDEDQVRQTEG